MPDRSVDIERVDRAIAHGMDAIEELAEFQKVAVVLQRPRPAAAIQVGAIRRAAYRPQSDPSPTPPDVAAGIARIYREFRGRGGQRVLDDIAADPHALAIHAGTGASQDLARFGM